MIKQTKKTEDAKPAELKAPKTRRVRKEDELSPEQQALVQKETELYKAPITGACSGREVTLLKITLLLFYWLHAATAKEIRDDLAAFTKLRDTSANGNDNVFSEVDRGPPAIPPFDKYGANPSLAGIRMLFRDLLNYYLRTTAPQDIYEDVDRFLRGRLERPEEKLNDQSQMGYLRREDTLRRFDLLLSHYNALATPEGTRDALEEVMNRKINPGDTDDRPLPDLDKGSPAMNKYGARPSLARTHQLLREVFEHYVRTTPLMEIHEDVTRILSGEALIIDNRFVQRPQGPKEDTATECHKDRVYRAQVWRAGREQNVRLRQLRDELIGKKEK